MNDLERMPVNELFPRCMEFVLHEEGGFVDNPHDPGGVTGAGGITLKSVKLRDRDRDGRLDFDLDGDGDVDRADMLALRADDPRVADVYLADYWVLTQPTAQGGKPVTCADFWAHLALAVFDCSINSGPRTAVALLQRAVGTTPDGVPGPKTLEAARTKPEALELYIAERALWYARLEVRAQMKAAATEAMKAGRLVLPGQAARLEAYEQGKHGPLLLKGWSRRLARVHTACVMMAHA